MEAVGIGGGAKAGGGVCGAAFATFVGAWGATSNCAGGKMEESGLERCGEDGREALLESSELSPPVEFEVFEAAPSEPMDDANKWEGEEERVSGEGVGSEKVVGGGRTNDDAEPATADVVPAGAVAVKAPSEDVVPVVGNAKKAGAALSSVAGRERPGRRPAAISSSPWPNADDEVGWLGKDDMGATAAGGKARMADGGRSGVVGKRELRGLAVGVVPLPTPCATL